jgi:hypothetical protein
VGVRAPVYVLSFGFAAVQNVGVFRPVCLEHARRRAVLAGLVSLVLGWWSPWGLFWTPNALWDDFVEGGVEADDEARRHAEQRARIGWRAGLPAVAGVVGMFLALVEGVFVLDALLRRF